MQLNEWFNRQNSSDNITTVGRSERCHGVACLVGTLFLFHLLHKLFIYNYGCLPLFAIALYEEIR